MRNTSIKPTRPF